MTKKKPRSLARTAGLVYLGYFAAAIFGSILVSSKVDGGIAAVCLSDVLYGVTTLFFYRLFRPVNGLLALVATALSLLGCGADIQHQINGGPAWLNPLLFFGTFCMLLGLLILRSDFLPGWLGWPLIVAGMGWLAFLTPAVALRAKTVIFPLGFLAELALMLWLLIKGVDEHRWAAAAVRRHPDPRN